MCDQIRVVMREGGGLGVSRERTAGGINREKQQRSV